MVIVCKKYDCSFFSPDVKTEPCLADSVLFLGGKHKSGLEVKGL